VADPIVPPSIVILEALADLLQPAFDAAPRAGAPMSVLTRSIVAGPVQLFPVCRLFVVDEYFERLDAVVRSNDWAGTRLDRYGWQLDYRPANGDPTQSVATIETQRYLDAWLLLNTLSASENKRLITAANPQGTVAELGQFTHIRYSAGPYGADGANVVLLAEGEFTVRKRLYSASAPANAAPVPMPGPPTPVLAPAPPVRRQTAARGR
jgi:hypothetical protein